MRFLGQIYWNFVLFIVITFNKSKITIPNIKSFYAEIFDFFSLTIWIFIIYKKKSLKKVLKTRFL